MRLLTRCRQDRGAAPLELVILFPVIVALLGLALFTGRTATVRQDVLSAAQDAARSAAARQFPGPAAADATSAAQQTLSARSVSCTPLVVSVDASDLVPGGTVTATVSCSVDLSDVTGLLGLPGSVTIDESSTVVVDPFRGGG